MSTDTTKIRSKVAKLNKSLDELESQLEPLFAQSLPETLLSLDTIQQAKLQTIIPYVVYDLVFVYLKSRGVDPKTHRVIAELDRVRQYFDKIKHAEESNQKRKLGIDKAAAGRFIKHAIAQARNAELVDEAADDAAPVASSSSNSERVPVKLTSKMLARAEYEKELKELGSEEEDLEVFDEQAAVDEEEAMDTTDVPPSAEPASRDKGKGRQSDEEQSKDREVPSSRRKRPRIDPFSGYEDISVSESTPQPIDDSKRAKLSNSSELSSSNTSSRGTPVSALDRKAAKKAKRKAKK